MAVRTEGPAPRQEFYSIGEVCALTDLKPHVLRYWESQFRFLSPTKNRVSGRTSLTTPSISINSSFAIDPRFD